MWDIGEVRSCLNATFSRNELVKKADEMDISLPSGKPSKGTVVQIVAEKVTQPLDTSFASSTVPIMEHRRTPEGKDDKERYIRSTMAKLSKKVTKTQRKKILNVAFKEVVRMLTCPTDEDKAMLEMIYKLTPSDLTLLQKFADDPSILETETETETETEVETEVVTEAKTNLIGLSEGDTVELNKQSAGTKCVELRMDASNAKVRFLYWYGGDSKFADVFALLSNNGIDVRQARDSPDFIIKGSRSSAHDEDFVSAWAENSNGLDIVPRLAGGAKQSARVKKETQKKSKIDKCQKLIDRSIASTTMDTTVQSILDIPADDLIGNAIGHLNTDQLGKLMEIQAGEIEHGERIVKKIAPILVPLISNLKETVMKLDNGIVALENAVMKSFVQKYFDGKFNLALFFQDVSNQKVALTTRDAVMAQMGQGDASMTG